MHSYNIILENVKIRESFNVSFCDIYEGEEEIIAYYNIIFVMILLHRHFRLANELQHS